MFKTFLSLIVVATALTASNSLIHSSSPYLRQHAENPIDWVVWDERVIERAKREHKPIFEGMRVEVDLLDKYTTSSYGRMIQNLRILAVLSEETRYERLAKQSLEHTPFLDPSLNAPSSMIAWLMGEYGVVTLSHKKEMLDQNRRKIAEVEYPYLYLHSEEREDFGACTIRGCFANNKDMEKIRKEIETLNKIQP